MAAVVFTFKIHAHREVNGRKLGPDYIEYVEAAANDYNSIVAVLNSNNKIPGQGTIQLSAVTQVSPTGAIA